MPPFTDRLSDETITGVIASFKSLWSDEHRCRHDRHVVPIMGVIGTTSSRTDRVIGTMVHNLLSV